MEVNTVLALVVIGLMISLALFGTSQVCAGEEDPRSMAFSVALIVTFFSTVAYRLYYSEFKKR